MTLPRRQCRLLPLLAATLAVAAATRCNEPLPPSGTSRPASPATAPGPADGDEPAALQRLRRLEALGRSAIAARRHGPLLEVAATMERLKFHRRDNAARRDELVSHFRTEAERIRDALHRFLFAELEDLPPARRKELLAAADRGQRDALVRAARALAEHIFRAGKAHLRSTPTLRAGRPDPATGLPVRFAGKDKSPWKAAFDEAFNAHMRALAAGRAAR